MCLISVSISVSLYFSVCRSVFSSLTLIPFFLSVILILSLSPSFIASLLDLVFSLVKCGPEEVLCPLPTLSARLPDVLVHHDEWISPTTEEPLDFAHGNGLEVSIGMSMSPRVVSKLETYGAPVWLITIHILASRVIERYTEHFVSTYPECSLAYAIRSSFRLLVVVAYKII